MNDSNFERDLGRLEGRQDALETRLNSFENRLDKLESSVNAKLDKLSQDVVSLTSVLATLNERAVKWKLPATFFVGAGAAGFAVLAWLDEKFPGISRFFK
jgi:hypothetical protein